MKTWNWQRFGIAMGMLASSAVVLASALLISATPAEAATRRHYCYQICHNNGTGACRDIIIDSDALSSHLRHGDCCAIPLGYCK